MQVGMIDMQAIRHRWESVGSKLDERGQRMFAAGEVRAAGWAFLHLSYSCATPFGPAILVTQDPSARFTIMTDTTPGETDSMAGVVRLELANVGSS
jgi:hypothetical protein